MIKVGNQTNSQDPQAVNSRVFVGNLNTFQATKTDVERLFQRYGRIAGISMHKGFAFIQFSNPLDARSACAGEDGRTIFGQLLDVNMVAEPKPAQNGRRRQQHQQRKIQQQQQQLNNNRVQPCSDWIYTSEGAAVAAAAAAARLAAASPPMKRARVILPAGAPAAAAAGVPAPRAVIAKSPATPPARKPQGTVCLDDLKTYSSPDIMICGSCRELFGDVMDMLDHKRTCCKLRFVCRCSDPSTLSTPAAASAGAPLLTCVLCKEAFSSAWDLMVHFQTAHNVNVYRLGSPHKDHDTRSEAAASDASSARDLERKSETPSSEDLTNGAAAIAVNNLPDLGETLTSQGLVDGLSSVEAVTQRS